MKHKKVWALPLAVLGIACFAFAGCDIADSTPATSDGVTDDSAQSEKVAITESTDPSTVSGEEVTSEQWSAAITASAFGNVSTKNQISAVFQQENEQQSNQSLSVSKITPSLIYQSTSVSSNGGDAEAFENYLSLENDIAYQYSTRSDGSWYKMASTSESLTEAATILSQQLAFLADAYSQSTYDATQKAYVATSLDVAMTGANYHFTSMTLKFVDGNLIYLACNYTITPTEANAAQGVYTVQQTIFCYDYGTTTVTLSDAAKAATVVDNSQG